MLVKNVFLNYFSHFLKILPFSNGLPVLMYHRIVDNKYDDTGVSYVLPSVFISQMKYLCENGYYFASLDEVVKFVKGEIKLPKKTIAITFDDGFKDNYINAFPFLKENSIKATIFINTYSIGKKLSHYEIFSKKHPRWRQNIFYQFLTWEEIKEMSYHGIEFESHTHFHSKLSEINNQDIENDILLSKNIIEKNLNKNVKYLSYPYGVYDDRIINIAKKLKFEAAWGITSKNVKPKMNVYALPRKASTNSQLERFKVLITDYWEILQIGRKVYHF